MKRACAFAAILLAAGTAAAQCSDGLRGQSPLAGTNGGVNAFAMLDAGHGSQLVAGGKFDIAGATDAANIALWDGRTWRPLGEGLGTHANNRVTQLAAYDGQLFAAGFFRTTDNERRYLATWDGSRWAYPAAQPDLVFRRMVLFHGELIAGGDFTSIGATPLSAIARWDGQSWSALGTGLEATDSPSVSTLVEFDGDLIVSGLFTRAGGTDTLGRARWDGQTWSPFGTQNWPEPEPVIVYHDELIGVQFIDGSEYSFSLMRWTGADWDELPIDFGVLASPYSFAIHRDKLVISGEFSDANEKPIDGLMTWDGVKSGTLGNWGRVSHLFAADDRLFGGFGSRSKDGPPGLAVLDDDTWKFVASEFTPTGNFAAAGGQVFASAPLAFDQPYYGIIRWEGDRWTSFARTEGGLGAAPVAVADGLIAYGSFDSIEQVPARNIARWDGQSWHALVKGSQLAPRTSRRSAEIFTSPDGSR